MNVSTEFKTIEPHGGELVDRMAPEEQRDELLSKADGLTKIVLGPRALSDLEMISTGVFSPLTGFMVSEDYESVIETMVKPISREPSKVACNGVLPISM